MSYTIYDLAQDAGVSVATVSRVINKKGPVKEITRKKILKLMEEKQYSPNAFARGMNNISMKTIGVIISDIINPFYAEVIKGIEDSCQKNGYKIILCLTQKNPDSERKELKILIKKQVQSFIIVGSRPTKDENANFIIELSKEYPVVLVNSFIKGGDKLFSVLVNEKNATKEAIEYLINTNQKNLYFLGDSNWKTTVTKINVINNVFKKQNLSFNSNRIISCKHSYSGGKAAAINLIEQNIPFPYTIFCSSDTMAIGAMREFLKRNIKIPEQVSIMGYSNIEVSSLLTPSLTTVNQHLFQLGNKSGNLIIDILSEKYPTNKKIYSEYELLIRESTRS
jgi:LacI family transcriptional regulator